MLSTLWVKSSLIQVYDVCSGISPTMFGNYSALTAVLLSKMALNLVNTLLSVLLEDSEESDDLSRLVSATFFSFSV